ncbi:MAG TPA: uroporphyrinogen-III synthase [Jatrophihabitantaceae bacterium]|nr:uroporphyrinogen-III synthase [Jatrophihabitantaceae bacterium]
MAEPIRELAGFTVGITAARRRKEFGGALERRGARVLYGPAIRIVPLADDGETLSATLRCLELPPDIVVVTTGIGFRGWMEAADAWGLGTELTACIRTATVVTRGPKARGAVRAAGLTEAWSPDSESTNEVLEHLLAQDLDGVRIAVQLHGEPVPDLVQALSTAGAEIIEVPVYRWALPENAAALTRLITAVVQRQVDAVAFTSAPAAVSMLKVATGEGRLDALLGALRSDVLACCVGPVAASPLHRSDVPTVQPDRPRLGALVRMIGTELPAHAARQLHVAGHRLEIRGHAVVVDDRFVPLPANVMAVLRVLARHPGRVVSRVELLDALSGHGQDEHAVEVTIARLRTALDEPRLIQTVVKRGYRLASEPGAQPRVGHGAGRDASPSSCLGGASDPRGGASVGSRR